MMEMDVAKPLRMLSAYFITTAIIRPPAACTITTSHTAKEAVLKHVYSIIHNHAEKAKDNTKDSELHVTSEQGHHAAMF
eukprot:CAMPEP_0171502652 /NCGR_PEP_ID=MMETSP0958-20121227/10319_1 /TAXON_ID=87120 /ORGANISM="Aurantiochytrium limacinum, Strain ATCCMYA-1381" /LENGTH=78 /DNA_ID=CAMNT_0012037775 /DNA_START=371 /DNA_END=607 /DNA_ORIENTATION=+